MNKKKESPFISLKLFLGVINKYNLSIFIVGIVAGLVFCVLTLSDAISTAYDGGTTNKTALFNQNATTRLDNIKTSDQNTAPTLPAERIDPFHE